ncbi:ATP-binding protein [Streptomyces megasporus]|uniref:ATP-binding protein n=1 Tax=Streptomyces megasporus TaxID=44060 RepID=UPI000A75E272|nr:ATP-binding protein [Streptomyces megasporus]
MNALAWALAADGDGRAREARAALEHVLRHAAGPDAEPAMAGHVAEDEPPPDARYLATALARRADRDSRLLDALRIWLRAHPPPHGPTGGHTNSIGGHALLHGPTVQARDIHGGIHVHQTPATPQRPPTPRQLPPLTAHFAGRAEDLADLEALRAAHPRPAPRLVVISGPAGVGKTTLASRWLGDLTEEFPDGQLYADLGGYAPTGPTRPADVLDRFLRALGVTTVPGNLTEQVALWRSVTADLRLTVLLDNAYTAAQVRPLVPGMSDSLVVVTSRQRLTGLVVDGAAVHHLRALEPDAALDLLRHGGGERVARDPETAHRVVRLAPSCPWR